MAQFQRGLKHSGAWENPRHGDANHVGKPDISAAFTGRPRARDTYKEGGRKRDGETNRGKYRDRKREREREKERKLRERDREQREREPWLRTLTRLRMRHNASRVRVRNVYEVYTGKNKAIRDRGAWTSFPLFSLLLSPSFSSIFFSAHSLCLFCSAVLYVARSTEDRARGYVSSRP